MPFIWANTEAMDWNRALFFVFNSFMFMFNIDIPSFCGLYSRRQLDDILFGDFFPADLSAYFPLVHDLDPVAHPYDFRQFR
jgi:hypothetical protein